MSGPKRNPDRLNTIGIVVVGICGAVLVYVSIAALQAFYMNDSSEIQTMADYGGNDTTAKSIHAAQVTNITEVGSNPADPKRAPSFHINIADAMKLTVEAAKADPSNLVPNIGPSDKPTVQPIYGRPTPIALPPAPGDGAGSGSDSGSGSGSGSGSVKAVESAPMVPTGSGTGPGGVAGMGAAPVPTSTDAPKPGARPRAVEKPSPAPTSGSGSGSGSGSAAKGNGK